MNEIVCGHGIFKKPFQLMLKFFLLFIVLFLAFRLVLRILGVRVFFTSGRSKRDSGPDPSRFSGGRMVEEADYEELDSRLSGPERDEG